MKAMVVGESGTLACKEVDIPEPGYGEVRIRMHKASVNYADLKLAKASFSSKATVIPGLDGAGIVDKVGPGVTEFQKGERVIAFPRSGSFADYAIADARLTYVIPDSLGWEAAAASPVVCFLSWILMNEIARVGTGDTVIIHSASGGVGTTAIQFAKLAGVPIIIGTVGSMNKVDAAYQAGADYVWTYDNFADEALNLTEGRGANAIFDSVAGKVTDESLRALAPYGQLIQFGHSCGEAASITTAALHKSCRSVLGFSLGTTRKQRPEMLQSAASHVIPLLRSGGVSVVVDRSYPLEEAAKAFELLLSRKHRGKVLLDIFENEAVVEHMKR